MKLKTPVVIFQSLKERHQIKIERWDSSIRGDYACVARSGFAYNNPKIIAEVKS